MVGLPPFVIILITAFFIFENELGRTLAEIVCIRGKQKSRSCSSLAFVVSSLNVQQFVSQRTTHLEQTCGFRKYTELLLTLIFESAKPPAKSCILKQSKSAPWCCVSHVIVLANSFTDRKMSGLPMRAKTSIFFKTICEHAFDNSPTVCNSSFLNWWSSRWIDTLYNCSIFLFHYSQYLSTHFFACPSMSQHHEMVSLRDRSQRWRMVAPCLPRWRIPCVSVFLNSSTVQQLVLQSRCVHPRKPDEGGGRGSSRSTFFLNAFPH